MIVHSNRKEETKPVQWLYARVVPHKTNHFAMAVIQRLSLKADLLVNQFKKYLAVPAAIRKTPIIIIIIGQLTD